MQASHTETPGNACGAQTKVHGKITPMVRKLYMKADQGDITLESPEALREKTSGFAVVAISTPSFDLLPAADACTNGPCTPP